MCVSGRRVMCVSGRGGAHRLGRVQARLRWKALDAPVPTLPGCLLVEEFAEQDGQGDAHKEKHDPTACSNDPDPRGYPLDRVILAYVGPEERQQQNPRYDTDDAADEAAQGQMSQKPKRLLELGDSPVQLCQHHVVVVGGRPGRYRRGAPTASPCLSTPFLSRSRRK